MAGSFALQHIFEEAPVCVIAGHYGVGKTNAALNLAVDAADAGYQVTLVDLDVVNPYFRSSEYAEEMEARGIRVVCPVFARSGSNLDVPSLSPLVGPAILAAQADFAEGGKQRVIIDAGGDDAGATAVGRYSTDIAGAPYRMLYVVNRYRNLTQDPEEALQVLAEIEFASRLRATGVLGNSHMQSETTLDIVENALGFAEDVATAAGIPLEAVTLPRESYTPTLAADRPSFEGVRLYPVQMIVKTPWERCSLPGADK